MFRFTIVLIISLIISIFCVSYIDAKETLKEKVECLSEAVYFEARSEPFSGQLAVANVISNRVKSDRFPNTYCSVVRQARVINGKIIKNKCAFSYYCDGKKEDIKNIDSYAVALTISYLAIDNVYVDIAREATHYHAVYVTPYWARHMKYLGRVGMHMFYKEE